jgi:GntR family transcriptional regulator
VQPIFTLLEEKYGIPLVEAQYKLEAVAASAEVAAALEVGRNAPIFQIERTSFTTGGKPVDFEVLSYRGDLIRFVTRLARHECPPKKAQAVRRRKKASTDQRLGPSKTRAAMHAM